MRTLYLINLSFSGRTIWNDVVFDTLVRCIERGEIRPVFAKTYPLNEIVKALKNFLRKKFAGKLVLIPPTD